ncbi:hypothetical protein HPB52_000890 [Rhipicephalus sanguineus]|uniref:Uncharacterized protein n=1 Tax=Rhipicephalus sanguineus TaxID=34632 RepID=A0A9D4SVW9_RHISA|nr:hypothetical protein HPB52_000890 [Rhipicephalus sanguineus]
MSRVVNVEEVKAVIRDPLIPSKRSPSPKSSSFTSKGPESHEVSHARLGFGDAPRFVGWISDTLQSLQLGRAFCVRTTVTEDVEHVQRLFGIQRSSPEPGRSSLFAPTRGMPVSPPSCRFLPTSSGFYDAQEQVKANLRVLLVEHLTNGINARQLHEGSTGRFGSRVKCATFIFGMPDVTYAVRDSTGAKKLFIGKRSGRDAVCPASRHDN